MNKKPNQPPVETTAVAQFNVTGMVIFSAALLLAGWGAGQVFKTAPPKGVAAMTNTAPGAVSDGGATTATPAPWGDLVTTDIALEAPEEYLAYGLDTIAPAEWHFPKSNAEQARALMLQCGLPPAQVDRVLTPASSYVSTNGAFVVRVDDELAFALTPEVRARFYRQLGKTCQNDFMELPYIYSGRSFEECIRDSQLDESTVAMVRKLLYPLGNNQCFSDPNTVMAHLKTPQERLRLLKVLSRQPAVLAYVRVRTPADIDRIIGYWGKGARAKDLRPFLESVTRMPGGSTVSLMHVLPPLARTRLYTFPLPQSAGDPRMDCHWSSLNFFREVPDNEFNNSAHAVRHIETNYYRIAKPSAYGDLICFVDEKGVPVHSAVYLADDLVFTKNGGSEAQPWKIARLNDLKAYYELDQQVGVLVWRQKNS